MKNSLAYETTALSLFFPLTLAVFTLFWQIRPQTNPCEISSVGENSEGRPGVMGQGFYRIARASSLLSLSKGL